MAVLQAPERPRCRGGLMAKDFILSSKTENGYVAFITCGDRLTRTMQFIKLKFTDTAFETSESFFKHMFEHHGPLDNNTSDFNTKFRSEFRRRYLKTRESLWRCQRDDTDWKLEGVRSWIGWQRVISKVIIHILRKIGMNIFLWKCLHKPLQY